MGTLIHRTFLLSLCSAGIALPAQELVWHIPKRGAVEYRRTWHATAGPATKSANEARSGDPKGKVPERYLPRLAPAPVLCQGELREDQKAIGDPVRDLRDVLRAVAFDLASRSSVRSKFPRVLPFGDLVVSGNWGTMTEDGTQLLRATVTGKVPAVIQGELRGTAEQLRPFCMQGVEGTLRAQRRIDVAAGLVTSFSAEIDLVVTEDQRQFRRFQLADEWQFVAVRDNQDADFRLRTADAIRHGVAFVKDAIDDRKSFLLDTGKENRSYGSGRLALALLTLLHGHVGRDEPVVDRGFDDLRKRAFVDTYSLATALMAMAARYAPAGEAERIRNGELATIAPRALEDRDRKLVQQWTEQLRKNVDPRSDATRVMRFNYVAGPRYDTSLQQYGLLGLWSAHTCGVEVPATTFAAAARHLLSVQCEAVGRVPLQLASYANLREVLGTDAEPKVPERRAVARGFAYEEAAEPPFGSMTSAGISGLLLARAGMQANGLRDKGMEGQIDESVRDAFAWLAQEFSVRANPGFAERADHHWYYWLYGLERSCELHGVAWLQGRDWYYEGAMQLFSHQQANGSFRTEFSSSLLIETTCFAVLFLAKSTPSAPITGG